MELKQKFFLNGLNELRAIAALAVIFHHIQGLNNLMALGDRYHFMNYFIGSLGKNGVFLFFVLSGFLITYLLLKEKEVTNTIGLKKFFLRRIYKIWPLYYLIFILSVVLIPLLGLYFDVFKEDLWFYNEITDAHNYGIKGIIFYLFLMPNVALYSGYFITGCTQAWSVGVEEQFYILWPILILMFNKNKIIKVFWAVLIFVPILILFAKNDCIPYPFSVIIKCIPFHFMAVGAIGGYFFFYKKQVVERYTISKGGYLLTIVLIVALLCYPFFNSIIQEISLSFLFLLLILFTVNDTNLWVFRNQYFSYLGKISYGIYMYHTFVMFLIFPIVNKYIFPFYDGAFYNLTLLLLIPSLTIGVSYFSYKYFEFSFIKIKDAKFKIV